MKGTQEIGMKINVFSYLFQTAQNAKLSEYG